MNSNNNCNTNQTAEISEVPNLNEDYEALIFDDGKEIIKKDVPQVCDLKTPVYPVLTDEERAELDSRSIYIGNVDYGSTHAELENLLKSCGIINKITIPVNKFTEHPKGYAYVEFASVDAVKLSMLLNDTEFRNRKITIVQKRTNIRGFNKDNQAQKVVIKRPFQSVTPVVNRIGRAPKFNYKSKKNVRHAPY